LLPEATMRRKLKIKDKKCGAERFDRLTVKATGKNANKLIVGKE
jgi:predicted nucleic-acid-binding Zn-ribbon protein